MMSESRGKYEKTGLCLMCLILEMTAATETLNAFCADRRDFVSTDRKLYFFAVSFQQR